MDTSLGFCYPPAIKQVNQASVDKPGSRIPAAVTAIKRRDSKTDWSALLRAS